MMSSIYKKLTGKTDSKSISENMDNESESGILEARVAKMDINKSNTEDVCEHEVDARSEDTNPAVTKNSTVDEADDTTQIVKEDVTLPACFKGKLAFVLYNVFSKKECDDFIKKTEKMGYTDALVNIGAGRQMMMKDVRNNSRCIWDSFDEADRIWQRIKKYVPAKWADRQVMGLNERLRFLKYDPGEYFAPHMDGCYSRDNGERSYVTIQLYLNEGFKGGSTTFMDYLEEERMEVVPKTGMVLVFQHDILHEGSELKKGRKYCLRTDVMYASKK